MLLTKLKKSIEYRAKSSFKPADKLLMADIIQEATIYVADKTEPAKLLGTSDSTRDILKTLEEKKDGSGLFNVLFVPTYPDITSDTAVLDIDEILSYAVINYACFLLTKEDKYKYLTDEAVGNYNCDKDRNTFKEI